METANRDTKLGLQIASQLRDEIVAGQLPVGSALRLASLAERLGVSTTPVREALTILERQGLVISQLHRGFRVAEITPKEIAALYNVHAYMSELLAESATRRLSEEDIDELEELDAQMREATAEGNATLAADLNHEFHRRINRKAGLPLVVRFLSETTPFVAAAPGSRHPGLGAAAARGPPRDHRGAAQARQRDRRRARRRADPPLGRARERVRLVAERPGCPSPPRAPRNRAKRSDRLRRDIPEPVLIPSAVAA